MQAPLTWKIFKPEILKTLDTLHKNQWLPHNTLKNRQNAAFMRLINHCRQNVPYFKNISELGQVNSLTDITKIPFQTKRIIKDNFSDFKSENIPDSRFIHMTTGGSTGESLIFYLDAANYISSACTVRGDIWAGYQLGKPYLRLWGLSSKSNFKTRLRESLKRKIVTKETFLDVMRLDENLLHKYYRIINQLKPRFIAGYSSFLYLFAKFLQENHLTIPQPSGVLSSAETLFDNQKLFISDVLKSKVYNRYGSQESYQIAGECRFQSGLHVSIDSVVLEIVDSDGNPVKEGESGEFVLTDLHNYVFPFVRYRIGDVGVMSDKMCECGRGLPLLKKVEVRTFDRVVGANGISIAGEWWNSFFGKDVGNIDNYQIIQNSFDNLNIKIVTNDLFKKEKLQYIKSVLYKKLEKKLNIKIDIVDQIHPTSAGKRKYIISKVDSQ